jgi:LCP family protein required for cell wall assembly
MTAESGAPTPERSTDALERLRRFDRRGPDNRRGAHSRAPRVRRRWPRRTLIAANLFTALSIMGAASAYGYVEWRLGQIKHVVVAGLSKQGHSSQSRKAAGDPASTVPPFTLLVIGSDTRSLGSGSSASFGNDTQVQGQRSDSIILVRVVPRTRTLALLSIPRDTLVAIPGMGTTRINAAFNSGKPSLLVQVLDQDFGIQVNHVAEFNFATFEQVASAVGGVEQWFPTPAKDDFSLLNIPAAGCYNLTGAQALGFVRSREYQYELNGVWQYQLVPESDLARIQRQQAFIRGLVRKARNVAPTNLIELNNIIGSVTKNLVLDSTFSPSLLLSLAQDFRSANLSTIPSYTYPTVNSSAVPGALDPLTGDGQVLIQSWLDVGQPAPSPSTTTTVPGHVATPPTTTVNPSTVSVEVVNGSGVGGQASAAGSALSGLGYRVTVSGDSPNFGLSTTQIEYAPDSLNAAKQLQAQLVGGASLVESSALTPTPYNLEVVTGTTYSGVTANAGSSSSPSTSTTSTSSSTSTTVAPSASGGGSPVVNPDSSSVFDGVYVPPGLSPGQVPQKCPGE